MKPLPLNLWSAWIGMAAGALAGMLLGLFFHAEGWLGGYGSWPRRMLRLGHISLFGLAFLNLALAWTAPLLAAGPLVVWASRLLVLGAAAMPAVCALAAWRKAFRHLFALPALCVLLGLAFTLLQGVLP